MRTLAQIASNVSTFNYIARNPAGKIFSGTIDAPDRRTAAQRLARRGLTPTALANEAAGENALKKAGIPQQSSAPAVEDHPALHKKRAFGPHKTGRSFLEKIYSLMTSGLPAGDAIKLLGQRVNDPALRALCLRVWHDLSEGVPLAGALSRFPEVFATADVRLIEAGEATGTLAPVIKRLLEHIESRETLRSKIIASLLYPICIIALACGVIALFIFFLMPMLQEMMEKLGGEMNVFNKILIALSQVIIYGVPIAVVAAIVGFFATKNWRESEEGRTKTDGWALQIPLIGKILVNVEASRLCSLLATLMENGLNTPDAMRLAERASGNVVQQHRISEARRLISDGASFTNAFRRHEVLPIIDLDIVTVGESTGTLPAAFAQLARSHEKDLDSALNRFIVVLSSVVLGSAVTIVFLCLLSIVMTILSVSQSAGQ